MMTSDVMASMDKYAAAVSAAAVGKAKHICAAFPHVRTPPITQLRLLQRCDAMMRWCWVQVTVETMVESGDPRDVICDATEKMAADLLVMGTHGYGLIQRYYCKLID
jgi:nucleotide-binding universal stress UspA family protein